MLRGSLLHDESLIMRSQVSLTMWELSGNSQIGSHFLITIFCSVHRLWTLQPVLRWFWDDYQGPSLTASECSLSISMQHIFNTQNLMRSCNKSLVTIAQEWMWWNEHVIGSHSPLTVRNWRIMIWLWRSLWHAVIHDFLPYNLIFMFQMPQYTESMSISDTTSLNDNDMALEINSYVLCQSWGGSIHIIHIIHIILVNIMLYYTQIFGTCSVHIKQYHTEV